MLVAAANDGYSYGDKSIGAPAIAKNVIAVGAAENDYDTDTVAWFSSRGPTRDTRIKPVRHKLDTMSLPFAFCAFCLRFGLIILSMST